MENGVAEEISKSTSRQNSVKDLSSSRGSVRSSRSLEKRASNTGSVKSEKSNKSEKDVQFSTCVKDKPLQPLDPSMKVPHKFITNWKQACDRTKDRTRDLLKRWRTLPESEEKGDDTPMEHTDKCGWSVHVWSTLNLFCINFQLVLLLLVPITSITGFCNNSLFYHTMLTFV